MRAKELNTRAISRATATASRHKYDDDDDDDLMAVHYAVFRKSPYTRNACRAGRAAKQMDE